MAGWLINMLPLLCFSKETGFDRFQDPTLEQSLQLCNSAIHSEADKQSSKEEVYSFVQLTHAGVVMQHKNLIFHGYLTSAVWDMVSSRKTQLRSSNVVYIFLVWIIRRTWGKHSEEPSLILLFVHYEDAGFQMIPQNTESDYAAERHNLCKSMTVKVFGSEHGSNFHSLGLPI